METEFKDIIFDPFIGKLITVFVGIMLIWLLTKFVQRNIIIKVKDSSNRYRTKKFTTILSYILILLFISVVYSDKLGGLTVAFGVAGAGIAFALQEVIASFAGWLAISFGGFFKTGDRVQLGGIKGDVMDIGLLRTTVMEIGQWVDGDLYNGRIVLISNSFVFKEPVFNYSGDFPFIWDEIKIPIQFGSNYEQAKTLFEEAAKKHSGNLFEESHDKWEALQTKFLLENAQLEPMVTLVINDNWVEYTVRYIVNYKKRRKTKSDLFTQILFDVEQTNGAIKFASATFQLVDSGELEIKINPSTEAKNK